MLKKLLSIILCIIAAMCLHIGISAEEETVPQVPVNIHPRVLVTAEDIPKLKERVNNDKYKDVYERLISDSKLETDGNLNPPASASASNFNDAVLRYVEANSFIYLTTGNKEYANKAKTAMLNYFSTYVMPSNSEMQMREAGDIMYIGAISYDWCYDQLTAADKANYISELRKAAQRLHIGYPPTQQGSIVGHGTEAQLFRDLLSVGIAVYDEDSEIFNVSIKRLTEDHIPARKFAFQAGFYHQGISYGAFRGGMEFLAVRLLDAIGYPNALGDDLAKMPYHLIYSRRPDGQMVRDGDMFEQAFGTRTYYTKLVMHAAGYYQDPYLMQEFLDQMGSIQWTGKGWDPNYISPTEFMLFFDSELEPKPLNELPYTRYFPGPVGAMIARTGWETGRNASSVVASMKVGEYQFTNHSHSDCGEFEIYYKGALATDTGIYQGTNSSYGSAHDLNYNKRTIAHNTMLVYDPSEVISSKSINDGGQRLPNDRSEPTNLDVLHEKGYKTAEVLAHDFGPDEDKPDYSVLKGDLTDAYSSKVKDFKRSFVFLNRKQKNIPAVMIVYDTVTSSNKEFKKYWLLHSTAKPELEGNTITINRADNGYSGKLVNTALLPKTVNTEVVEGFDVFGETYDTAPKAGADRADEGYSFRVQISPSQAAKTDRFLNVMQIMDGEAVPMTAELIETSEVVGAKISQNAVLFKKDGGKFENSFTFKINGRDKNLKILINDLDEGLWLIKKNGQDASLGQVQVEADEGTMYFTGDAGEYTITRTDTRLVQEPRKVFTPSYPFSQKICVEMDGNFVDMTHQPKVINGIVMVPMKEIFALFGKAATYDEQKKQMTSECDNGTVIAVNERKYIDIGGMRFDMEQSSRFVDGELYIPLSVLTDCFHIKTSWSQYFNEVTLANQPVIRFEVEIKPVNAEAIPIKSIEVSSFQEGNEPLHAVDNNIDTRWSAEGEGEWAIFDLGETYTISGVGTAWMQGSARVTSYDLFVSEDGKRWTKIYSGASSGGTNEIERVNINAVSARYVKLIGGGNSVNKWNSLTEIEIYGE